MSILDSRSDIQKLDSKNMLGSLEQLANQVQSILQESNTIQIPNSYKQCRSIVIAGMGGSTLGSHIIKSVFYEELAIPCEIVNGYKLPAYVNEETFVLISSYSGTTEEALACFEQALEKKSCVMVITSGGVLQEQARKKSVPAFIFFTKHNPCGSPRMGLGYSIVGQMILLGKIGFISFSEKDAQEIVEVLQKYETLYGADNETTKNIAKQIAQDLVQKSVWFVGSEHLVGSAHVGANQINENAKRFAGYFVIPELNHHLLEGMMFPKTNQDTLAVVLLQSALYDKRIKKRYEITEHILKKNNILHTSYVLQEKTFLAQVAEALVFTSYVSYYSALLENIDPTAIPFVDYFKEQLRK